MNVELTYCSGYRCALRSTCVRYLDGQLISDGVHQWMQCCDEETREGYIVKNGRDDGCDNIATNGTNERK